MTTTKAEAAGNGTWMVLALALIVAMLGLLTLAPMRYICKDDYNRDMLQRNEVRDTKLTAIDKRLERIELKVDRLLEKGK